MIIEKLGRGGRRKEVEEILYYLPITKEMKVLDIGLGKGEATEFFIAKGFSVSAIGIDVELYSVSDIVRKNCQNNCQLLLQM